MMRVGIGYDVHPLTEGRRLILGGVEIPFPKGLKGHSDADVLCHAIADALLGAAALGDIGHHFPDTDERHSDVSSITLLGKVNSLLEKAQFKIDNVDSTVVVEQPKIAGYIPQMRKNIAGALGIGVESVSVKATTSEGMGFVGAGHGVSAYAVAAIARSSAGA